MIAYQIGMTASITVTLLLAEHWFPWKLALRRELPRPTAYILGVLAIVAPLMVLYLIWITEPPSWPWAYIVSLLANVIFGGLAVLGAYWLDDLLRRLARADEINDLYENARQHATGKNQ